MKFFRPMLPMGRMLRRRMICLLQTEWDDSFCRLGSAVIFERAYSGYKMKLAEKFSAAVRFVFSPGAASYDRWRQLRFILLAILIASALAVGFGFALYHLNTSGRM